MKIILTFDVEIWCNGWENIDKQFPTAFKRYVYGKNKQGFGLPQTLEILNKNNLQAVFFVEPLFAYRFGMDKLKIIVQLIQEAGQDVQLHLHPEWVDEIEPAFFKHMDKKRPYMFEYTLVEQSILIKKGIDALKQCGVKTLSAFRSGSFACNLETLEALKENKILIDSSINPSCALSKPELDSFQPKVIHDILEYPITTFTDGIKKQRHWQVGAVGFDESIELIKKAKEQGFSHLVLVSHNFEMLIPGTTKTDLIVAKRFQKLCAWLAVHHKQYPVTLFSPEIASEESLIKTPEISFKATFQRLIGQAGSRILAKM